MFNENDSYAYKCNAYVYYAAVVQRLVYQPSKLRTRVRFPFAAPIIFYFIFSYASFLLYLCKIR